VAQGVAKRVVLRPNPFLSEDLLVYFRPTIRIIAQQTYSAVTPNP